MMTVIELAKRGGVAPNVIRYYSRVGLLTPERNQSNGYKLFRSEDIDRLRFIRLAQHLGYSLAELGELLTTVDEGDDPCAEMRAILRSRIVENRQKLAELAQMQARMEHACLQWKKVQPEAKDLDALCDFIEAIGGKPEGDKGQAAGRVLSAWKAQKQGPKGKSEHDSIRPSKQAATAPRVFVINLEEVMRTIPGRLPTCVA